MRKEPSPATGAYVKSYALLAFLTIEYYLSGSLPEVYHAKKGEAWLNIHNFRRAAWQFRKHMKYSEDAYGPSNLAWCYDALDKPQSAVQYHRLAYRRRKDPHLALSLARCEHRIGNLAAARTLIDEINRDHRHTLRPEYVELWDKLDGELPDLASALVAESAAAPVAAARVVDAAPRSAALHLARATLVGAGTFALSLFVTTLPGMVAADPTEWLWSLFFIVLFTAIVGVGLLLIQAPALSLCRRWYGPAYTRGLATLTAGLLAPITFFLFAAVCLMINGGDRTFLIQFRVPSVFVMIFSPFAIGSALFGHAFYRPPPS